MKLFRWLFSRQDEWLFHPDSPGVRVKVSRSRVERWVKPNGFATIGEVLRSYRG